MLSVAVVDDVPTYRCGLLSILAQAGIEAEECVDPQRWARESAIIADVSGPQSSAHVVLLVLRRDESVTLLSQLAAQAPHVTVVVLLMEASTAHYRRAFKAGAAGAVPYDAPAERILNALHAARTGDMLLPEQVIQGLLVGGQSGDSTDSDTGLSRPRSSPRRRCIGCSRWRRAFTCLTSRATPTAPSEACSACSAGYSTD